LLPRRPFRVHRTATLLTIVALAAGLGACGGANRDNPSGADGNDAAPSPSQSANAGGGDVLTESKDAVALTYKGTYKPPDATPRPAVRGKKIAIISGGQSSPSSSVPVGGAAEAAKELGWDVTVLDMQLNPANGPRLVKEAINSDVDALVVNFDCLVAPNELADAKARGIKIISLYGFDCDDQSAGPNNLKPLFTTVINYGLPQVDTPKNTAGFGALLASAIIAGTDGKAKVISFTDPAITALRYVELGFTQQIQRCKTCELLETVTFSSNELGPSLQQKVTETLRRHPDATAIHTPYTAATLFGIAPAVVASGRVGSLMVVGGEGFTEDLDLMRTKKGVDALAIIDSIWTGWAVIDSLNSTFLGEQPRPAGFGTILVDREHNLPPSGPVRHNVDFKGVYRKAWGVQ
jgi:ribose transport system substrate-binding protein